MFFISEVTKISKTISYIIAILEKNDAPVIIIAAAAKC